LDDYANHPDKLGIKDISFLAEEASTVTDEVEAFTENMMVLKHCAKFMEECAEVFSIMSSKTGQ
jgi:hypothetical protein